MRITMTPTIENGYIKYVPVMKRTSYAEMLQEFVNTALPKTEYAFKAFKLYYRIHKASSRVAEALK